MGHVVVRMSLAVRKSQWSMFMLFQLLLCKEKKKINLSHTVKRGSSGECKDGGR